MPERRFIMLFLLKLVLIILVVLIVLYLLMIMPRMFHKPDRAPYTHRLYAHRGLHDNVGDAPENSLAAFQLAVEGDYGIELDVQLTKDGIPVVFHDFELARVARYDETGSEGIKNPDGSVGVTGKVSDYTFEELQAFHLMNSNQRIPKFEEVLQLVDGRVPLIVEMKIEVSDRKAAVCEKADALLRKYKGVYCMESFHPFGVYWYRKNKKDVLRGQLAEVYWRDESLHAGQFYYKPLAYLMLNFITKPDFIAYNYKHRDNLSLRLCKYLYHNVMAAWTIKSQEALEESSAFFDILIFDSFVPDPVWREKYEKR